MLEGESGSLSSALGHQRCPRAHALTADPVCVMPSAVVGPCGPMHPTAVATCPWSWCRCPLLAGQVTGCVSAPSSPGAR